MNGPHIVLMVPTFGWTPKILLFIRIILYIIRIKRCQKCSLILNKLVSDSNCYDFRKFQITKPKGIVVYFMYVYIMI